MEDVVVLDRIEAMKDLVDANLEAIIAKQTAIYGQVAEVSGQVVLAGGKRIRPILVMLAYEIAGGEDNEEIMPLALSSEFIHSATLVHDDINDESLTRLSLIHI